MNCLLCKSSDCTEYQSPQFFRCPNCDLIFKHPDRFLTAADEKARYKTHENDLENPGYKEFLWPAVEAVKKFVPSESQGIDYGCGPTNALATLLKNEGFPCDVYDPYFYPEQPEVSNYDFMVCTEVAEHFYEPATEFFRMLQILKENGVLVIMTELYKDQNLKNWYYVKDPTHVVFYSKRTMAYLAEKYSKTLEVLSSRLVVLKP